MFLFDEILKKLQERGEVRGPGKNGDYITFCIFHPDQQRPNLYIHPQKGFYCFACEAKGSIRRLAKELGIKDSDSISLTEFAEAKQLDVKLLQDLGWQEVKQNGKTVIEIPYLNENGEVQAIRYRLSVDGEFKFKWRRGDKVMPYGLQRLSRAREAGYIVMVEGETDATTLWKYDFPALGIPGAKTWRRDWAKHLEGLKVFIWQEPDEAGKGFVMSIAESLSEEPWVIKTDETKDACELHSKHPEDFVQRFKQLIARAEKHERKATDEEELNKVKPLLDEPHILRRFIEHIASCGVVGEEKLAGILTLVLESANTDRPINIGIIAPPSSGKNHVLKMVLNHFSDEAYIQRSGGSERSFIFSDESLKHRFLIFDELGGYSTGEVGKALLHSLTWDNKVNYELTVKKKGQFKTMKLNKPGPTGFLFTSTNLTGLDEELRSRLFLISTQPGEAKVDQLKKQTQGVLYAIADRLNGTASPSSFTTEEWKALFRVLLQPEEVEIPWGRWLADKIAHAIDASSISIRRKFELFLYFACSSALLHRFHRNKNGNGRVVADVRDYANARALIGHELEKAQKDEVSSKAREIAGYVRENSTGKGEVSRGLTVKEIATVVGLSSRAVHYHLEWLNEEGYIKKIGGGKGKAIRVIPGEPLPEEPKPLPDPNELVIDFPQLGGEWMNPINGEKEYFHVIKEGGLKIS